MRWHAIEQFKTVVDPGSLKFHWLLMVHSARFHLKFLFFPKGLHIDWKNRNLYFTNEDFAVVDRVAFSWHRIEVVGLDGTKRRSIVTDVELPRGLWVDSVNKLVTNSIEK